MAILDYPKIEIRRYYPCFTRDFGPYLEVHPAKIWGGGTKTTDHLNDTIQTPSFHMLIIKIYNISDSV